MKKIIVILLLTLGCQFPASIAEPTGPSQLKLPAILTSNMVIQRDISASIWGWAAPGEKISVAASWGESAKTQTGTDGNWKVKLPTPKAGGPHTITIVSKEKKIVLGLNRPQYSHKNTRSVYYSLKRGLPFFFTYLKYPKLNISKTTNTMEGNFSQLKNKLRVHQGLTKERRYKVISEILKGQD